MSQPENDPNQRLRPLTKDATVPQSPETKPAKARLFGVPYEVFLLVGVGVLAYSMYIDYFRH